MAHKIQFSRNKLTPSNWFQKAKNNTVDVPNDIKKMFSELSERLDKVEETLEQLVNKK